MKKYLLLSLALLHSACGKTSVSLVSDVGTDLGIQYIYFLEQDSLILGACPSGTIVINRANCPEAQRILAWTFYDFAEKHYFERINQWESNQNQIYVLLEQIDVQLNQLFLASSQYDQSLLPAIRRQEGVLSSLESEISGIRDQIARILSDLSGQEDPDLRQLLHQQQQRLQTQLLLRSETITSLNSLRTRHLSANDGIISNDTYRRTIRQRKDAVERLSVIEPQLNWEIAIFGGYLNSVKFLKDSSVWNFTDLGDATAIAVNKYQEFFRDLASHSKGGSWSADGKEIQYFTGLATARISSLIYSNRNSQNQCSGVRIEKGTFKLSFAGNGFSATAGSIQHYPALAPIFNLDVSGLLKLVPICTGPVAHGEFFSKMTLD